MWIRGFEKNSDDEGDDQQIQQNIMDEMQIIVVVLNVAQVQSLTSRCLAPAFPGFPPLAGLARPGEHG